MKDNSILASKLKQYTLVAGALAAASGARAQVTHYKNVDPDVVISPNNGFFNLDLNNDDNFEYTFSLNTSGIDPSGADGQVLFYMYMEHIFDYDKSFFQVSNGAVKKFNAGDIIGSEGHWAGFGIFAFHYSDIENYAWDNEEKFIGVKFRFPGIAGDHYGWIRVAVSTDNPDDLSVTVKDYAYMQDSNVPIKAGDVGVPCLNLEPNNSFSEAVNVSPGNANNSRISYSGDKDFFKFVVPALQPNLRITLSSLPRNYDMKLFDANKQLVAKATNLHKVGDTIIYNNAMPGAYYIKVYQKDGTFDSTNCYSLKPEISASPYKISNQDIYDPLAVHIFPNPAKDFITIEFGNELKDGYSLFIYDLAGMEVMKSYVPGEANSLRLDVSALAAGIYLMKTVSGNDVVVNKFSVGK